MLTLPPYLGAEQPGSSLVSRTRIKTLAYDTILANARFFNNDLEAVPRMALTVGIATVLDAREVILVVTGSKKAMALSQCIENGVNHFVSFSDWVRLRPRLTWVCSGRPAPFNPTRGACSFAMRTPHSNFASRLVH